MENQQEDKKNPELEKAMKEFAAILNQVASEETKRLKRKTFLLIFLIILGVLFLGILLGSLIF